MRNSGKNQDRQVQKSRGTVLKASPVLGGLNSHIFLRSLLDPVFPASSPLHGRGHQMQMHMRDGLPGFLAVLHADVVDTIIEGGQLLGHLLRSHEQVQDLNLGEVAELPHDPSRADQHVPGQHWPVVYDREDVLAGQENLTVRDYIRPVYYLASQFLAHSTGPLLLSLVIQIIWISIPFLLYLQLEKYAQHKAYLNLAYSGIQKPRASYAIYFIMVIITIYFMESQRTLTDLDTWESLSYFTQIFYSSCLSRCLGFISSVYAYLLVVLHNQFLAEKNCKARASMSWNLGKPPVQSQTRETWTQKMRSNCLGICLLLENSSDQLKKQKQNKKCIQKRVVGDI